jgi:RNA polymerase sigma-70 factor, ECF subfamily
LKLVSEEKFLLDEARKLNSHALADIYDEYSPGIYRYAMRLIGDQDQAEECTAETFSRFLHTLHRNRAPRDHLRAYLYRIAHNWIVDLYRKNKPEAGLDESIASGQQTPEQDATENIERDRIRKAIRKLTSDQQQVIYLKYLEEWSNAEIASALDKPIGAVKSLQHRALAALKRHLKEEEHG